MSDWKGSRGQEDKLEEGRQGRGGASRGAGAERRQTPKTGGGAWHPETHIRRCCQEQCNRRYGRKQKFPELKADQVCISKEGRSYRGVGGGTFKKDTTI